MSGVEEDPGPNVLVQGVRQLSSSNLGFVAGFQNGGQDTGNESTTFASEIHSLQSRSLSQESYRISEPSILRTSPSSLPSKVVQGRFSPRSNSSSDERNRPGRSSSATGVFFGPGQDSGSGQPAASQNIERRQSRVSFNPGAPRSYDAPPPPGRRRSWLDDDDDDSDENHFYDKSIRNAFIRKVYLLIMCMMLFTTAVISFMMFHIPTRKFVLFHPWLVIVAWAAYPLLMLILICCGKVRRTVPYNYFVLFLVTLVLSFMAGCSAARFDKFEVLGAFGLTAAVCLGLTLFAFQTRWDFTVISGGLIVASILLMVFGIVLIFWRNKIAMIAYSCLGALLGCMFFIFDTQMMMGGNHRYAVSPEEYVFAAITLFTDMINIFILIMNIIGLSRD